MDIGSISAQTGTQNAAPFMSNDHEAKGAVPVPMDVDEPRISGHLQTLEVRPNPLARSLRSALSLMGFQDEWINDADDTLVESPTDLRNHFLDFVNGLGHLPVSEVFDNDTINVLSLSGKSLDILIDISNHFPFWVMVGNPMTNPNVWVQDNIPIGADAKSSITYNKLGLTSDFTYGNVRISDETFFNLTKERREGAMYFHATTWEHVPSLLTAIEIKGRTNTDFSRTGAFYLGRNFEDAVDWGLKRAKNVYTNKLCIFVYRLPTQTLREHVPNIDFGEAYSADWDRFVRLCRREQLSVSEMAEFQRKHNELCWIYGPQCASVHAADFVARDPLATRRATQLCLHKPGIAGVIHRNQVGVVYLDPERVLLCLKDMLGGLFDQWKRAFDVRNRQAN